MDKQIFVGFNCFKIYSKVHIRIWNVIWRVSIWSNLPKSHGEDIQFLRYEIGQEYKTYEQFSFNSLSGIMTSLTQRYMKSF